MIPFPFLNAQNKENTDIFFFMVARLQDILVKMQGDQTLD